MTATAAPALPRALTPLPDHRPAWAGRYQLALVCTDLAVLLLTVLIGLAVRFPRGGGELRGVPYALVAVLLSVLWWGALALTRSYEVRFLGEGAEEFRRTAQASLRVAAIVGVICYLGALPLSRGFVAFVLPVGAVALLAGRVAARRVLRAKRDAGVWHHRVLAVGTAESINELAGTLQRDRRAGLTVVGACVAGPREQVALPDVGSLTDLEAMLERTGADTVAVTGWPGMSSQVLRELAYAVEGSHVDLLVAPSLLASAGPRATIRPVAGLPLLELTEIELTGAPRIVKEVFDRCAALVALLVLLPVLLAGLLATALSGDGQLIVQERWVGRAGRPFDGLRVRTRVAGQPSELAASAAEQADRRWSARPLTRVGAVLERCFVDDVPQLINVLRGEMSLVGPRALPPGRRDADDVVARRLRVKPGMTGLAQISRRHDVSAVEALRLDQHYVDTWSLGLDLLILLKTSAIVIRGGRLT